MMKIINYTATPDGLTDQMKNKVIEVVEKKTYDMYMNNAKELADFMMKRGVLDTSVLFEINNKEVELLDNVQLVEHLSNSEKLNANMKKFEQQSKATRKKFKELSDQFDDLSMKVANL